MGGHRNGRERSGDGERRKGGAAVHPGEMTLAARADEATLAALNRSILERLQLGGEAFLTSTELRGRYTLRACVVNYRSTRDDIDRMLNAVRAFKT